MSENSLDPRSALALSSSMVIKTAEGTDIINRGNRGARGGIEKQPSNQDLAYHKAMSIERGRFVGSDPVLKAITERADTSTVIRNIREEVAKEAANMYFDRVELEKKGKVREAGDISKTRVATLRTLADLEMKERELAANSIDITSPQFKKVLEFWMVKVTESAQATLPEESYDMFMNHFGTSLENLEDDLAEIIAEH